MKFVVDLFVRGLEDREFIPAFRAVRRHFKFDAAAILFDGKTGTRTLGCYGRADVPGPLYGWATSLTHVLWRECGHYLSTTFKTHRLLDDARVYPRYVEYIFDDEGEHDAMKIEDAKRALVNPWPELEPHIIDQEISVLTTKPKRTLREILEDFFDPAALGRLNRSENR